MIRTPLLPSDTLVAWAAAPDPRAFLAALVDRPKIDEALFVASPGLHGAIAGWRDKPMSAAGQRVERTLVKYIARMAARATPFGLFSGVSVGALGATTRIELAPQAAYARRTRLDNDYLFILAAELSRAHVDQLVVRPSSSLYRIGGRIRYAATEVVDKDRRYHLVSVEPTPYLDATLARAAGGARSGELAAALVDDTVTLDEARAFVAELIAAEVLVPDLGVHVTGPEPLDGMIAQLRAADLDAPAATLERARRAVAELDVGPTHPAAAYRAIAATLEGELTAKVDLARLFQVDLTKPGSIAIGRRVAADVLGAMTQLARLSSGDRDTFAAFKAAFSSRYEEREVPLAEVLDEEAGIGFEASNAPGSEGAPLLAKLGFPGSPSESRVAWRARESHLLRLLDAARDSDPRELVLTDADFDAMAPKPETSAAMADAFCTMVRLAATSSTGSGDVDVLFEGASGPSGARLLGRFCHASPALDALVRTHLAREEALAPDAAFAEIVHLNEGRIGNVLCRPVLRAHEIVFLGVSGAPRERQLELDDLTVAVRGGRIVLRSRRLGREVIPRLTTAHNYRNRSLGVYRFLCALAEDGVELPGWTWGPLGDAPRLPRVRYGRVVLARARWNLVERDLAAITAAVKLGAPDGIAAAVAAQRTAHRLPRFLVIADNDNELPIDLDHPMLVAAFADELAGRRTVRLLEMFPAPDRQVVHGPEGAFANEVVLTFTRVPDKANDKASDQAVARAAPAPTTSARRSFGPGSEWLYAKIYCGESTGDRVLRDAIAPVLRDVHRGPWFFIRYRDPDPHVRVRFRGDPARLLGDVLPALDRALAPLIDAGVARKLVLDTYDRELERYGGDVATIERIFHLDSEVVLGIVELLDGDAGADARWRLALRGIDSLLEAIGLDAAGRAAVVTQGRDMLGREYHADTAFWARIGDRFTTERASLDVLFARDPARDADHDLEPGFALLARRDEQVRALDLRGVPVREVAWSLVHMHANRLLHASQRAQELVLYDFLRRLHASRRARAKT